MTDGLGSLSARRRWIDRVDRRWRRAAGRTPERRRRPRPRCLWWRRTGDNDGRVNPAQSRKMTARLQAADPNGRPILLRTNSSSGHGIGNTRAQQIRRSTDVLAFMLWQFGDPEFQPAKPES